MKYKNYYHTFRYSSHSSFFVVSVFQSGSYSKLLHMGLVNISWIFKKLVFKVLSLDSMWKLVGLSQLRNLSSNFIFKTWRCLGLKFSSTINFLSLFLLYKWLSEKLIRILILFFGLNLFQLLNCPTYELAATTNKMTNESWKK